MIICIDVGNTNIKYAIYDKDDLKFSFRVATDFKRTSDEYGAQLTASVQSGNVYGCQFHPEKSGKVGLEILRAFCQMEIK